MINIYFMILHAWIHLMLGVTVGHNLLSNFFLLFLLSHKLVSLLSEIYFYLLAILPFSSSSLAQEDWDFLELPDDLLCLDSLFLEDTFDDLLSVSELLNQLWIFLLKVQTLLFKSSNQASSSALSHHKALDYIPLGCLVSY